MQRHCESVAIFGDTFLLTLLFIITIADTQCETNNSICLPYTYVRPVCVSPLQSARYSRNECKRATIRVNPHSEEQLTQLSLVTTIH